MNTDGNESTQGRQTDAEQMQAVAVQEQQSLAVQKQKKGFFRSFFGGIGHFFRRHKVIGVLLVILAIILGLVLRTVMAMNAAASAASAYSFVRTTTLAKGNLTDSVSCTGTVESATTSNVTYSTTSSIAAPKVKTVSVAVGDMVQAGDVIVTLDTSNIEESIAKEKDNISEAVTAAQTSYDRAVEDLATAQQTYDDDQAKLTEKEQKYNDALNAYNIADNAVSGYQASYDHALSDLQLATSQLSDMGTDAIDAQSKVLTLIKEFNTAAQSYSAAIDQYYASAPEAAPSRQAYDTAKSRLQEERAKYGPEVLWQIDSYIACEDTFTDAKAALAQAKSDTDYDTLKAEKETAKNEYDSAKATVDGDEKSITSQQRSVEDAKTKLADASKSDTLDNLQDQLADCNLTAPTSGKVTALNVKVGDTPSSATAIATIQDDGALKVSITIDEADINSVQTGMSCQITSDATEGDIAGTLTQIDPVANDTNKFGAEVTVADTSGGLKIGMQATVKVILSNTSDCYTVPIDAVGDDNDGQGSYVYRKTGGEGTDMTFEKVYITVGNSNDYYIEINGDTLADGDVIRSSADLTQGVVDITASTSLEDMMAEDAAGDQGGGPDDGGQGGGPDGGGAPAGGR